MLKRVAVAGATGYTGRKILIEVGHQPLWDPLALVRPGSESKLPEVPALEFETLALDDVQALTQALKGCAAVIQTIGTTKAQFKPGVSYETVDYGTTVALIHAALAADVPRFLLLSSTGAGFPIGEYLLWKNHTEQVLRQTDLTWTIFRPAAIVGRDRRLIHAASLPFTLLSSIPVIGNTFKWLRPISATTLAETMVASLDDPLTHRRVLEGSMLWGAIKRQKKK